MTFTQIIATELENGKYRFEAVESDGTRHVIRKAGKLTKGMLQIESNSANIKDHFYGLSGYKGCVPVKSFTPNNGIEVVPYQA